MRRLPVLIHGSLALASLTAALLYLIGQVLTDQLLITQYIFWVPSLAMLGLVAGLSSGALIFGAVRLGAMKPAERPRRSATRRFTRAAMIATGLIALSIVLVEWRVWRLVFPPKPAPPGRSLIVMHWNMTVVEAGRWGEFLDAFPLDPRPDIVVLTNPIWSNELGELADRLGREYTVRRVGTFAVASRFGISNTRAFTLGIGAPPGEGGLFAAPGQHDQTQSELLPSWSPIPRVGGSARDPGHLITAQIDTTSVLGHPIVVWGFDLPSDIRLSRYTAAKEASRTIEMLMFSPPSSSSSAPLLANPDLIVGDFNTPRGSASLRLLSRGYSHAFDQAGHGYAASWPRQRRGPQGQRIPNPFPIFLIDQAYLAPSLRATKYELVNPNIAEHYVQRITITSREP